MNDSANLPEDGGSKTVDSFSLSDPRALNFAELGEEDDANANQNQVTEEATAETQDDGDENLPSDLPDDVETGDEDGQNSDDDEQSIYDAKFDDTVVTLKGGEQVPVKELKLGYMRERDYRSKTQEVANSRRSLEAMSQRVEQTAAALSKFLVDQLPPEPDRALAVKDPGKFASQKAVYDAAMEQVNELLTLAGEPKAVTQTLTDEQRHERLLAEKNALHNAFPDLLKTRDQHEKFFEDAFDTARQIGFTDQELGQVTDHRYFKLAHYARIGMQAEAAKQKALEKVANAPASVPRPRANTSSQQAARQNKDAMKRLAQTGSIHDAMAIDFD